ncbi:hypothetical protein HDU98_001128, partial [Podochytrium sp. JEL0797]
DPIVIEIVTGLDAPEDGASTPPSTTERGVANHIKTNQPTSSASPSNLPNGTSKSTAHSCNQRDKTSLKLTFSIQCKTMFLNPNPPPKTYSTPAEKKAIATTRLTLQFFYLPRLDIITVSPPTVSPPPTSTKPTFVHPTLTLHTLFPTDTSGLDSPNPATLTRASQFSPREAGGFAYMWAQRVCGLAFAGTEGVHHEDGGFEAVVGAVRARVKALEEVEKGVRRVVEGRDDVPVRVGGRRGGRVVGWKDVVDEENQNCVAGMLSIQCQNTKFVFSCDLASTYPATLAKFSFVQESEIGADDSACTEASECVNEILSLVNTTDALRLAQVYGGSNPSVALVAVYQMGRLVACLGRAVEVATSGDGGGGGGVNFEEVW